MVCYICIIMVWGLPKPDYTYTGCADKKTPLYRLSSICGATPQKMNIIMVGDLYGRY
jgi:hypothetical protein